MNRVTAVILSLALLHCAHGEPVTINHDQVKPFAQPEPVTISEKAAVKFKPQIQIVDGCVPFPAVNSAGEITGGLKPTKGTDGCTESPMGSQVYGRSSWYQDYWVIMYAWYFPKNFRGYSAKGRHGWASMILWLDNPAVEHPKILGASLSHSKAGEVHVLFWDKAQERTVSEIQWHPSYGIRRYARDSTHKIGPTVLELHVRGRLQLLHASYAHDGHA